MKTKLLLLAMLIVGTVSVATGCKKTPYQMYDKENYTVSVKYDANGGLFAENVSTIVDSYNISEMQADANGNVNIPLITPDHESRKNDGFTAQRSGYFFAGWYENRTQTGVDEQGNPIYEYSNKWDFESDRLSVKKDDKYTSTTPELVLYAAWIPLFQVEIYSLQTGEILTTMNVNPTLDSQIEVPTWSEETGTVVLNDFPKIDGSTYNGIYWDADGKNAVTEGAFHHPGVVNYETGTAEGTVVKVYADMLEGEWYRIYTVEQFIKNVNVDGCYEIFADLDFTDVTWPNAFVYGDFTGTVKGNGHKLSNITIEQTNNSKMYAGLFGNLTKTASVTDIVFENLTFTISAGARVPGACLGLFAGNISADANISGIEIVSGVLQIDSESYFAYEDYSIGLLCGDGNEDVFEQADVSYEVIGDNTENLRVTIEDNKVKLEFLE